MRIMSRTSPMVAAAFAALAATTATADDCAIEGSGSVRILANDFTALRLIFDRVEECASDAVEVTRNETTEHKNIQVPSLTTDPAAYTVAVIANGSVVPLLNEGLVRPLDDLVERYGQQLAPHQLIRVDGQVMAVAFMANAQHLVYRSDLLEANGIEPPTSYEELIAAADVLMENGVEAPFLANFKSGWHMGEEFVNMYLGMGGEFFEPGSARLAIQNETGIATLEMLKALSERMGPDYATFDTNVNSATWLGGDGAFMTMWGSAVGRMIDEDGEAPEVARATVPVGALTVGGGTVPAATLWWDGFTIATNVSDEDASVSFQAMMHGIAPELAEQHPMEATWLIEGYEPTPAAAGVFATMEANARPYPMLPYIGLLHMAAGENLSEYLQGTEDAEQALADIATAYEAAAREGGFIE